MQLVSLQDVTATVGAGVLFEAATVVVDDGDKVGLVGRNGSGKSTLLRLFTAELAPDQGQVTRRRDTRLARLEQRPLPIDGCTVDQFLDAEAVNSQDVRQRYRALCTQLAIDDFDALTTTLSGGMLKKAAIARAMAVDYDLLLLDEPTNHLDIDAILWLEARLRAMAGGFILVTHDRWLLDAVCTVILEIEDKRLYRHEGNYSVYLDRRAQRERDQASAEQRRVSVLRRELAWVQRGPQARTGKDKARLERAAVLVAEQPSVTQRLAALPAGQRRLGKSVLTIKALHKQYGSTVVIDNLDLEIERGQRVGIIGPNGCGKTTLLDIVAGRTLLDSGEVRLGETVVPGYFDQIGRSINQDRSVLDYIREHAERVRIGELTVSAEQFLERFLFPRSMLSQPLARLSGGEFRRLFLIRVLATVPNLLLLDEPTNDLDIDTMRVLEAYIEEFAGSLLMVSHDRALLNRLTDSLLVFDGCGGVQPFVGDYATYYAQQQAAAARDKRRSSTRPAGRPAPAPTASGATAPEPAAGDDPRTQRQSAGSGAGAAVGARTGLSFRERREYAELPQRIDTAEAEARQLEQLFQLPTHTAEALAAATRRYHDLQQSVAQLTQRWEELAKRADD